MAGTRVDRYALSAVLEPRGRVITVPLKLLGYWHSSHTDALPHPQSLVDPSWERLRRGQIVAYLKNGMRHRQYLGLSYCRFQCGQRGLGSADLTDGTWVWPEGLSHYVDVHSVRLPDEFVQHAAARDFEALQGRVTFDLDHDISFWTDWCRRNTVFSFEPNCVACAARRRLTGDGADGVP